MTTSYAVVDSGTTTTRVRLWRNERVVWSGSRAAGARDTATDGSNARIRTALTDLFAELDTHAGHAPEAVISSGMITSNMGLLEVPHLSAPVGMDDLADGIVRHDFPEITELPFYFIPGVKTLPISFNFDTLADADVLRGEEAECVGLRELLRLCHATLFLHFGSHHKVIATDAGGRVLYSRTAVTGELLSAVSEHTILRSSTVPVATLEPSRDFYRAGLRAAEQHGVGRALFLVRVGEQLWGRSRSEMTSFLLGVLSQTDLPLLDDAPDAAVVLYGKGALPQLLAEHLTASGRQATHVDEETSDQAAAVGAVRLFERYKSRGEA